MELYELPIEIINLILEFSNYHKFRNGKYITQLDKNLPIFRSLTNIDLIEDGKVELFVKYVKRKNYCTHKIKIIYFAYLGCYCIKEALDELDYYHNIEFEIAVYNMHWYYLH
jgi:hypothetical protein